MRRTGRLWLGSGSKIDARRPTRYCPACDISLLGWSPKLPRRRKAPGLFLSAP